MAENEDSNSKNGALDFRKRRGIYVPVAPTTSLPIKVLFSFWRWIGIGDKTFWNWLELLIVPLFLAGGAVFLERQTEIRQEQIATNRYQQEALAKYLDQMTALLLDENLRKSSSDSEARSIARARTITALQELDGDRKGLLIRFLHESNLISASQTIVSLYDANLSDADLRIANLSSADLSGADLSGADLSGADLSGANLSGAILYGGDLNIAILNNADLSGAGLDGAKLNYADLRGADLRGVILHGAILYGAKLDDTNLSDAVLCRTTMPDQKVENRDCP